MRRVLARYNNLRLAFVSSLVVAFGIAVVSVVGLVWGFDGLYPAEAPSVLVSGQVTP